MCESANLFDFLLKKQYMELAPKIENMGLSHSAALHLEIWCQMRPVSNTNGHRLKLKSYRVQRLSPWGLAWEPEGGWFKSSMYCSTAI